MWNGLETKISLFIGCFFYGVKLLGYRCVFVLKTEFSRKDSCGFWDVFFG